MATLAFDTLQYARRLLAAGVPEGQANVQAELMAEAFGFYADNLVTRDYLDARLDQRFAESERWIDRRFFGFEKTLDGRFAAQDKKFDSRFAALEQHFDGRFAEQDKKFDSRFAALEQKFDDRCAALERKFDGRFTGQEQKFDSRSTAMEQKFESRFTAIDDRFGAVESHLGRLEGGVRLHTWMLGLILLVLVVPELERFLV